MLFAGYRAELRAPRPRQPRADGVRGAGAPRTPRRHRRLGGAATPSASTPRRPRGVPCRRRNGRRRWAGRIGFPSGWRSSSARWRTDPPPPSWGSGCRACFPARSGRRRTGSSGPGTRCAGSARPTRRPGVSRSPRGWPSGPRATRSCPARRCSSAARVWRRRWPTCPTSPTTRRPQCSSAAGWRRWATSPTSSSRPSPRSAGAAGPSSCSTSWRAAARGPICATPKEAVPSASCTPSPHRWPARCCSTGCRRRTAPPRSGTPGRLRPRCTWPTTSTARPRRPSVAPPSTDALIERALASGDEHAIKLCEAAVRTFGRTGDPVVLLAAADASARF